MQVQDRLENKPKVGNSTKPMLGAVPAHKFPYNWNLKDANFTKDKGKVFSCFAWVVVVQQWVINWLDYLHILHSTINLKHTFI